jgi:hypothetical protein
VSDQDFFFDEDDAKPVEKTAPKKPSSSARTTGPRKAPASKPSASKPSARTTPAPTAETGSFFDQDVNMAIAALLVVCGLLLGMALGLWIGETRAAGAVADTGLTAPAAATGGSTAPPLTQDQLNSSQLPTGHPALGGATKPSTTATK